MTDIPSEACVSIDIKCSDGLCGVCKCSLVAGDVEHCDFVLSAQLSKTGTMLCQPRAQEKDGVFEIDL